nr:phospholipase-like, aminotransferase-like mobile domain protein [Tanacetum cinerariifolium]
MKDRLGLDRCVLLRETCFGRWLDLTYVQNEESLIHYMLQKQKVSDNDDYDLPLVYNVNDHTFYFGRREFCLISGFKLLLKKDLNQKHRDSTSGKQCDLGDKYWSDQDGESFFQYMGSINPSANKDVVKDLLDALDDLVDDNGVVEVDKNLSHDDFLKAQKLEAEKNRMAEQKRLRLQLMMEEANSRKSIDFSKFTGVQGRKGRRGQ